MEVLLPAALPAFLPTFCFAQTATGAAPLGAIIITIMIAAPIAAITSLKQTKSAMAIVRLHAMTPILVPSILLMVRPPPAIPFAVILTLQLVLTTITAALQGAIALMTMIALRSVQIIWSKRVKFATVIAKQLVKTIMPAPSIPPRVIQPPVISNAIIRIL